MPNHVFSEIYIHVTWHTLADRSMLAGEVERYVHQSIQNRCRTTDGVFFHGIGGTVTHIHLALRIAPSIAISEVVRQLKGGSAHEANARFGQKAVDWQRGYGVVSFGKKNLEWILEYVRGQKEHHAKGIAQARLEACGDRNEALCAPHSVQEEPAEYGSERQKPARSRLKRGCCRRPPAGQSRGLARVEAG